MNLFYKASFAYILITSFILGIVLSFVFSFLEPQVLHSATVEDQITVNLNVLPEISFQTTAIDVILATMSAAGGVASDGAVQVVVSTNNTAGYSMSIKASSTPALQGVTQSGSIPDYAPSLPNVPDYSFTTPTNVARFGYTVSASTTSDLDSSFLDNGANTCNVGSNDTGGTQTCWLNLSTTNKTIINRPSATLSSGATTTIAFKLDMTPNPVPNISADIYTATTTLTAAMN